MKSQNMGNILKAFTKQLVKEMFTMEHVRALIIKFIMCTAILLIVLGGFYGVSFADILTIGVILTALAYVVGDLYFLPRFENWGASIADFGLAFIGIWFLGSYLIEVNIPLTTAAVISALLITVGEYFFHKYMASNVLDGKTFVTDEEKTIADSKLQTEFSSEMDEDLTEETASETRENEEDNNYRI